MKSHESRFYNNLDPLQEYFDEPEWDSFLPTHIMIFLMGKMCGVLLLLMQSRLRKVTDGKEEYKKEESQ